MAAVVSFARSDKSAGRSGFGAQRKHMTLAANFRSCWRAVVRATAIRRQGATKSDIRRLRSLKHRQLIIDLLWRHQLGNFVEYQDREGAQTGSNGHESR